jgi:hypothetical protein
MRDDLVAALQFHGDAFRVDAVDEIGEISFRLGNSDTMHGVIRRLRVWRWS